MKNTFKNWLLSVASALVVALLGWIGVSAQTIVADFNRIRREEPTLKVQVDTLNERSNSSWRWKKAMWEAHERDSLRLDRLDGHRGRSGRK